MRSARRSTRGLSMIEVLAAMVIFSTGATVLFGWIGQTSERLARLAGEQRELFTDMVVLEYMKTVNPMLEPAGEIRLSDGVLLRWQSERLPGDDTVRGPGSLYELGLYRVKVRVSAPQQGEAYAFAYGSAKGDGCAVDGDCGTGHCVDSACCNTACGVRP